MKRAALTKCWTCGQWVAPGAVHAYRGDYLGRGAIVTHAQRDATPDELAERARRLRSSTPPSEAHYDPADRTHDTGGWHNND